MVRAKTKGKERLIKALPQFSYTDERLVILLHFVTQLHVNLIYFLPNLVQCYSCEFIQLIMAFKETVSVGSHVFVMENCWLCYILIMIITEGTLNPGLSIQNQKHTERNQNFKT